jgi:hypothetical protein
MVLGSKGSLTVAQTDQGFATLYVGGRLVIGLSSGGTVGEGTLNISDGADVEAANVKVAATVALLASRPARMAPCL